MTLATPAFADGVGVAPNGGAPIVFFDIAGPDAAKPPEKILYSGVADLDTAIAKVKASGGTIETPKLPTPTGEQFVLFKDPAGNRMGIIGPRK